jgi:hypothetical protein
MFHGGGAAPTRLATENCFPLFALRMLTFAMDRGGFGQSVCAGTCGVTPIRRRPGTSGITFIEGDGVWPVSCRGQLDGGATATWRPAMSGRIR